MPGKEVTLIFNLKGTSFSDIHTMKNEQARALPSFSHGPHSKQEDVSRILQILASVCNAPAAAVTTGFEQLYSSVEYSSCPCVRRMPDYT